MMELLGEDCKSLKEELSSFCQVVDKAKTEEDRLDAEKDMLKVLDKITKNVASLRKTIPTPEFAFNSLENYVLAYYNIEKEELKAFSVYYNSMFDEMDNLSATVSEAINNHAYSQLERDHLSVGISCFEHSLNAFYYGSMGSMSLLPKSSREMHFKTAKKWKCFPNGTPFDLSQEEYEQFQMQEMARCEEELNRFNAAVNYEEQQLTEMEDRIDKLEKIAGQ